MSTTAHTPVGANRLVAAIFRLSSTQNQLSLPCLLRVASFNFHRDDGTACRCLLLQVSGVEFDRAGVAAHAKNLANKVKGGLEGSLKTLGVEVVDATGELAGANTVKAAETGKTFTAKDIILAPGSLPFVPPGVQVIKEPRGLRSSRG